MSAPLSSDVYIHQDGFAARLRQLLAAYGSPGGLARAIGRSEGAVRKWMHGKSEPNVSDLRAICEQTRTNVEWLVTGRGNRELPPEVREASSSYSATPKTSLDYALLENIMDTVDEELLAGGIEIASTKRSAVVVTLYNLFRESRQIDREAVTRLVNLAG